MARQPWGVRPRIQRIRKVQPGRGFVRLGRRPTSKSVPTWQEEAQEYALPIGVLRGDATILDRMIARYFQDHKIDYTFQYAVNINIQVARVDFAVWNVGFKPFLGVEGDGWLWHMDTEKDAQRDFLLYGEGITNVHLHEADMMKSKERFEFVMKRALMGDQLPRPPMTVRSVSFKK